MIKTEVRRMTAAVVVAHVMIVALVCFLSMGSRPIQEDRPGVPEISVVSLSPPVSYQSVLDSPSILDPTTPVAIAPPEPSVRKVRHQKTQIVRSTNLIERVSRQPALRLPTEQQVRHELLTALSVSCSGNDTNAAYDRDRALLHATYYDAWTPPPKSEVGTAVVTVRLLFEPDGRIRNATIITPSGNQALDKSVALALGRVRRVPGLSQAILHKNDGYSIAFTAIE